MFSPVQVGRTAAYPELKASVGKVLGRTINGPAGGPSLQGGPVYGLNDVSQPNTSPDTLTVNAALVWDTAEHGHDKKIMLPSGTPVLIVHDLATNRRDKHHQEPVHKMYTHTVPYGMVREENRSFMLTVLVGNATFVRGQTNHCAIAVQNVTSLFLKNSLLSDHFVGIQKLHIGDHLFLTLVSPAAGQDYKIKVTSDVTATGDRDGACVRFMRVSALLVGNEIKCDMGRMVYFGN